MSVSNDPKSILASISKSGFPFQLGIADCVERGTNDHGWELLCSEHAWSASSQRQGFIDIVAARHAIAMVIECKKAADKTWAFLVDPSRHGIRRTSVMKTTGGPGGVINAVYKADVDVAPASPEAAFCILPSEGVSSGSASRAMLERTAAELILATEAFAYEDGHLTVWRQPAPFQLRYYVSVIVTNASLAICELDPSRVDLETGSLPEDAQLNYVPVVRFRKQFGPVSIPLQAYDWKSFSEAVEHTVFVVRSEGLHGFLKSFRMAAPLA